MPELMLYNVDIIAPGSLIRKSEWMSGTSYSHVLLKCRHKWPDLGQDCFIINATQKTWDEWIKETERDGFN